MGTIIIGGKTPKGFAVNGKSINGIAINGKIVFARETKSGTANKFNLIKFNVRRSDDK